MTATLDKRTLLALSAIATPDEIVVFQTILDDMSWGHCDQNMAEFVIEIIRRMAGLQNTPERR